MIRLDAHKVCLCSGGPIIFIPDAFEPFECTFIALFSGKKLFISNNVKEQQQKRSQILYGMPKHGVPSKFPFSYMERVPGGIF